MLSVIAILLSVLIVQGRGGTFWHISDLHLDYLYEKGGNVSNFCHQQTGHVSESGDVEEWGNYQCDSPLLLVDSALMAMKTIQSQPEFIVWTGDSAPHWRDPAPPSQEYIFNVTKYVFTKLDQYFPGVPIVPALGNHDASPPDMFPVPSGDKNPEYYDKLWSEGAFGDHIDMAETSDTFHQCGYYTKTVNVTGDHGDNGNVWRFIVLNTNIYYHDSYSSGQDPCGQLTWMNETLNIVDTGKEKVLIVAHVPPGSFERMPGLLNFNSPEDSHEAINERYMEIVTQHADKISAHLYGHLHTDTFRLLLDTDNVPVGVAFMAGSVTPILWVGGKPVGVNPTIRLMEYGDSSGVLTNYDEYYLDIAPEHNDGDDTVLTVAPPVKNGRRKNSKFRQDSLLEERESLPEEEDSELEQKNSLLDQGVSGLEEQQSRRKREDGDDVDTVTEPPVTVTTIANNVTTDTFTPVPAVPNTSAADTLALRWTKLYSAREAFHVPDLSPQSMYTAFISMLDGVQDTGFSSYYRYNTGGHDVGGCDDQCWQGHMCTIASLTLDKLTQCLNTTSVSSFYQRRELVLSPDTTTTAETTSVPTTTTSTTPDDSQIQIHITSSSTSGVTKHDDVIRNENDHSNDSEYDHDGFDDVHHDEDDVVGVKKEKIENDGSSVSAVGIFFGICAIAIAILVAGFGYKKYRDNRYRNQEFLLTDSVFRYDGYSQLEEP